MTVPAARINLTQVTQVSKDIFHIIIRINDEFSQVEKSTRIQIDER